VAAALGHLGGQVVVQRHGGGHVEFTADPHHRPLPAVDRHIDGQVLGRRDFGFRGHANLHSSAT
jgi:hypothetical protein